MAVKDRDRFSTATRIRVLGEQTAARVYRSQPSARPAAPG
ncbi:hypothetical protein SVIOM74S_00893 [Streptomyces violarus]